MKHLITIVLILVTAMVTAQTNYEKGMQKAFSLWEQNNMDDAENMFERISNVETDQWLPHYYIAQINSLKSWNLKDETKLKAQLDKAQEHLDLAMAISKENPELLVLQAHVLTNWVAFDGMTYGMKYSGKINELYNKAFQLAPENPRVVFSKAEWDMGSARYFGQDTAPFCADIEKSIELFVNFKPESQFHPAWGKQRAEQVLASCKE
ncbi:tetratricopeptide repeat protein [Psychroserpens sp. XS_ASV72]|uniref:tetratricopeptide repeat protein n=1 Tax=Psychroserpens sp. XS_ASV72 TaxID=3241293 RepID=UPI0035168CF0